MSIQKKSLLSSLSATKKAIVATSTSEATPSVKATVSARLRPRKISRVVSAKFRARLKAF